MANAGLRERYYDCVFAIYNRILYGRLAKLYDLFFSLFPVFTRAHERVIEGLNSGSILDVGCGTGTLLALARRNGLECHGIDLSEGMLGRAKQRVPDAQLKVGDFESMPYRDNRFDYVVCTNAIGSVRVNPRAVISEMLRVCKREGEVRIADWAEPPRRTLKNKVLIGLLKLSGDTPYDYPSIVRDSGHEPDVEILGLCGGYQLVRVTKRDG